MRSHPDRVRELIRIYIIREQHALLESRRRQEIAQAATQGQGNDSRAGENGSHERESDQGYNNDDDDDSSRPPPTRLTLRLKKYKRSSPRLTAGHETNDGDSPNDVEEDQCTICCMALEDGDRVGSLKCDHLFHSDCLKLWLQRRNACPLCQMQDIAEPRYEQVPTDSETSASQSESQVAQSHLDVESNR